jgi:hypothetical protein
VLFPWLTVVELCIDHIHVAAEAAARTPEEIEGRGVLLIAEKLLKFRRQLQFRRRAAPAVVTQVSTRREILKPVVFRKPR